MGTSIRYLDGAPRYLRVNANDETNLLTLNDDTGGAPRLQFREQGAERHRVTHNPLVGTEGSYQLVSATGRVDVSIDHATGAASSFAAIPTVLVVPVTNSATLAAALADYNGMVTPITISLAAGTYDGTTMMAMDYNYSDITFLGPDVGAGRTAHGINGATIVTAGNDLTPTPDFTDPPAIGGVLRYFDVTTQAYTDFNITNVVAGTYTLDAAPPAAPTTGDTVFVLPAVTINNWPAGALDLGLLWYSSRSTVTFRNVVLSGCRLTNTSVTLPTFSECIFDRSVLIGSATLTVGFITTNLFVFQRLDYFDLTTLRAGTSTFLSDVAGNATNPNAGLLRLSDSCNFQNCLFNAPMRHINVVFGVATIRGSDMYHPTPSVGTGSLLFSRGTSFKVSGTRMTSLVDKQLAQITSGGSLTVQNGTYSGIAAGGTVACFEASKDGRIDLWTCTVSGGGYFISVATSSVASADTVTFGPPAAAINSYIVDGAASAGPLPLISATTGAAIS